MRCVLYPSRRLIELRRMFTRGYVALMLISLSATDGMAQARRVTVTVTPTDSLGSFDPRRTLGSPTAMLP